MYIRTYVDNQRGRNKGKYYNSRCTYVVLKVQIVGTAAVM
jgi:hypothetical protein